MPASRSTPARGESNSGGGTGTAITPAYRQPKRLATVGGARRQDDEHALPGQPARLQLHGDGARPPIQLGVREGDVLGGLGAQEGEGRGLPQLRRAAPEDVSEGPRVLPDLANPTAPWGVCVLFHGVLSPEWNGPVARAGPAAPRIHRRVGRCPSLGKATEKSNRGPPNGACGPWGEPSTPALACLPGVAPGRSRSVIHWCRDTAACFATSASCISTGPAAEPDQRELKARYRGSRARLPVDVPQPDAADGGLRAGVLGVLMRQKHPALHVLRLRRACCRGSGSPAPWAAARAPSATAAICSPRCASRRRCCRPRWCRPT